MRPRLLILTLTLALCASAADKKQKPVTGYNSNELIGVRATAYIDKDEIKQTLGSELEQGFLVVEVQLKLESDRKVVINRDDFLLRTDKDGQRAQPYAASQIAGSAVLIIGAAKGQSGIAAAEPSGPAWGGIGGGRPSKLPGTGTSAGNTGSHTGQATVIGGSSEADKKKENPLLDLLEKKILAEGEMSDARSGLLYFMLEGKQKTKDLELIYKSPMGHVSLRFK